MIACVSDTRLLRFFVRHPHVVITVAGAINLCAFVFIPRIQLQLDGRSLIPSNLPQFAEGDDSYLNSRRTAFDGGSESQPVARLRCVRLRSDRSRDWRSQ